MTPPPPAALGRLCALWGVQPSYLGVDGRRRTASPAALLAVLRALGAPVERVGDAEEACRARTVEAWGRPLDPVALAPARGPARVEVRWPSSTARLSCRLDFEDGAARTWTTSARVDALPALRSERVDGRLRVARALPLPGPLPLGTHRLRVEASGIRAEATVIAAPSRAPALRGRTWGVFCPAYALRSARDLGAGDLGDLEDLLRFVASLGGGAVATLPILASLLDTPTEGRPEASAGGPFEPSPYSPASRLFWNEHVLALDRLVQEEDCPEARQVLEAPETRAEVAALREAPLVDWRRLATLHRRVLAPLARAFFARGRDREDAFLRFVASRPDLPEYARFRAVLERRGAPWCTWATSASGATGAEGANGTGLPPSDGDAEIERVHLYAQWAVSRQIQALAEEARGIGPGLYLDFPLGVHPDGYDVWRERRAFALDASVGAPPDSFFPQGQDWGFPPLRPDAAREGGHRYFAECLARHAEAAGVLRLDHVMGLHRLYWIPKGFPKNEGVYVRYPSEELHAVVRLAAHRHGTVVVGENLGTVPRAVDQALARHGLLSTYVVEYAASPSTTHPLPPVPEDCAACVETHDMPPFAAFLKALDVPERVELGLLPSARAVRERRTRTEVSDALTEFLRARRLLRRRAGPAEVLRAVHAFLAESPAALVLVNLEDLWLETLPQNVPGTWRERPNWRRKARLTLEEIRRSPEIRAALLDVAAHRARGGPP